MRFQHLAGPVARTRGLPVLRQQAPMTVGAQDPVKRELESMGVVASSYEPLEIRFNQFIIALSW